MTGEVAKKYGKNEDSSKKERLEEEKVKDVEREKKE
jgi:hypothetical protein